jgi:2-dehydro-3-deoxyphosphogluconate aldolase / (4S)-4-hydroxy-2-oxoglutarate aldolase
MTPVEAIHATRLIAIVRGTDRDSALRTVLTLAEEGIEVIEVSLTTHDAPEVIRRARDTLGPAAPLGAGTVITTEDAALAYRAGANFVVTPALGPAIAAAQEHGLPVICGALTPSEVAEAMRQGAQAVKLFPASLGGVGYLRALRDPFPQTPFIPVGGIDTNGAREFLAAGAVAVGIGSPLVGDAASDGSVHALRQRARHFRSVIKAVART